MKAKRIGLNILQVLLALAMLMAGIMKLTTPYEALAEQMAWVENFTPTLVMGIALLEVLMAVGMIMGLISARFHQLAIISAIGIGFTMLGAIITHIRFDEGFVYPLVLMGLAALIAIARRPLNKQLN